MENPGSSRSISRDHKRATSPETKFASRTRHGTKLGDILKCDKPVKTNLSYADFHHEITKNPEATLPRYVNSQHSQVLDRRVSKEDELVRYMSNLPSYLEKGQNLQGKALNFGVLDWRHLEKWQWSQKQTPGQQIGCSPSSSTTSLFSTDGSSAHSSKGLSCSPSHQRILPSVPQYHPKKVSRGGASPNIEVFGEIPQKFQDSPVNTSNNLSRQQRGFGVIQSGRKESDLKSNPEMGEHQSLGKSEVGPSWKGKLAKETVRSQDTKLTASNKGCSVREKSGDVFMPTDPSKHKCPSLISISSFTLDGRLSVDPCHKSILGRNNLETDLPPKHDRHNKQLDPSESSFQHANGVKTSSQHSNIPLHPSTIIQSSGKNNAQGVKGAPRTSNVSPFPARILSSPSKCQNAEEKKPRARGKSDILVQVSEELGARRSSASVPKARNPSPIRRLGSAMGKIIKNTGSRDNSPIRRSSSKESEGIVTSVSTDHLHSDKLSNNNNNNNNNNNRARSSPFRRLLDPLLKPRASNCSDPSKKLSSTIGIVNSSIEPLDHCVGHSQGQAQAQALLQVSSKNGLPLFTFAINNESSQSTILAATMRKCSGPRKGHNSWIYTFFTVREVKRKSGIWLSQSGKGDGQGYVPNVVAQMKVSDSINLITKSDNPDHNITREYNLFAVDGDQYANDFHPTNELAAIIVKLLRSTREIDRRDGESSCNWFDMAQDSRSDHSVKSQNFRSTVILPSGVHTVPSKGELSTLAERWRSGGLCDCGGWDLGCQLRVYTNKKEPSRTFLNKDKFELFSQGNQDGTSILSLAPFKERIYSVEFSSSLSLVQAFAISMSFIDCRRPLELPEQSVSFEKISEACIFEVAMRTKTSNQGENPTKYYSNPPHSPVGRV